MWEVAWTGRLCCADGGKRAMMELEVVNVLLQRMPVA